MRHYLYKFILFLIIINSSIYSQDSNKETIPHPFLNYKFPTNLGIIEFLNDNPVINITEKLNQAMVNDTACRNKFTIYPYKALDGYKKPKGIKTLKDINRKVCDFLIEKLNIEFLVAGNVIDSMHISFRIIRTVDVLDVYNKNLNGNNTAEIIQKIIDVLTEKLSETMVLVEGGNYLMGSDIENSQIIQNDSIKSARYDEDESPIHNQIVKSFFIDKYEVTVKEYKKFCEQKNRDMPDAPEWGWVDDNPIVNVSWDDAKAFAEWAGKRLPKEFEWEFAAKGGNKSKNYSYSGSNNLNEIAWFYPNSNNTTHTIGQKNANELGIADMSGNVWEWCEDSYHFYGKTEEPGTKNFTASKVIRGGSFKDDPITLRVCNRSRYYPLNKADNIGFRCAKDVK